MKNWKGDTNGLGTKQNIAESDPPNEISSDPFQSNTIFSGAPIEIDIISTQCTTSNLLDKIRKRKRISEPKTW